MANTYKVLDLFVGEKSVLVVESTYTGGKLTWRASQHWPTVYHNAASICERLGRDQAVSVRIREAR